MAALEGPTVSTLMRLLVWHISSPKNGIELLRRLARWLNAGSRAEKAHECLTGQYVSG